LIDRVTRKDPTGILKVLLTELRDELLTRLRKELEQAIGLKAIW
jgi:hypothetical protein